MIPSTLTPSTGGTIIPPSFVYTRFLPGACWPSQQHRSNPNACSQSLGRYLPRHATGWIRTTSNWWYRSCTHREWSTSGGDQTLPACRSSRSFRNLRRVLCCKTQRLPGSALQGVLHWFVGVFVTCEYSFSVSGRA